MGSERNLAGGKRRLDRAKDAKWREVMSAFGASGLSVREFCKRNGIGEPSFYSWRRTLAQRDGQVVGCEPAADHGSRRGRLASTPCERRVEWAPVTVVPGSAASDVAAVLEIRVGDELRIGVDGRCPAGLLDQVLTAVRGTGSTQAGPRC